jgi:hypothetical protein
MRMDNDNNPKQLSFGIINAYNYWDEIIKPNWLNYLNAPTPRTAFNLANSLWSVMDWIKHDVAHGMQELTLEQIRNQFKGDCPALAVVHDLCTHGKHYTVSRPKSGDTSFASGELTGAIICFSSPIGPVSEHTADFAVVNPDSSETPLDEVFQEVISHWENYFNMPR